MTYFRFLAGFIVLPIVIFLAWWFSYQRAGKSRSEHIKAFPFSSSFLLLAIIAVLYTTPWDNYLVATRVWWYDPSLVLGITIGWVPIEEYLFFVMQPILGGLFLLLLLSRRTVQAEKEKLDHRIRKWSLSFVLTIWILALANLIAGKPSATYLALELIWALPVIILQLLFGADILWRHRRVLFTTVFALTIYLSFADAFAIQSGVWTINPGQSLGVLFGRILPVEEFVFFLLTNIMVVCGFLLVWSPESHSRMAAVWKKIRPGQHISNLRGGM